MCMATSSRTMTITMRSGFLLLILMTSWCSVMGSSCYVPSIIPTPVQKFEDFDENDYFSNGHFEKVVVLIGEDHFQHQCKFIHFYNKLTNGYNVSEDLCIDSLQTTSMYKSKKTIYVHMPLHLSKNVNISNYNIRLLNLVLKNEWNVTNDFIIVKSECTDPEMLIDNKEILNVQFNADLLKRLLKSFSAACVNIHQPLKFASNKKLADRIKDATKVSSIKTLFYVEETHSMACNKHSCSLYSNWKTSCSKELLKLNKSKNQKEMCVWHIEMYDYPSYRFTTPQKLALNLLYDEQTLKLKLQTYENLISELHLSLCQTMTNNTNCVDNLNYIGTPDAIVSDIVYRFYEIEMSYNFNIQSTKLCSYLYSNFYSKSNIKNAKEIGNLCKRINHIALTENRAIFSNRFFNFELYKMFGTCIPRHVNDDNSRTSTKHLSIDNKKLVYDILSKTAIIPLQDLEAWAKELKLEKHCTSYRYIKLLYIMFRHQQTKVTSIKAGSACIFEGQFLSLTSVIDQSHGCKSVVMISNDTVFLDESRSKVRRNLDETELYIFAPRWIAITSFENNTQVWTRMFGLGLKMYDDSNSFTVQKISSGFQISHNVVDPFKYREHLLIYLKSVKSNMIADLCNTNNLCTDSFIFTSVINEHLTRWSYFTDSHELHLELTDYILSFETLVENHKNQLDKNFYYLCQNVILTFRIFDSSIESQSNLVIDIERALLNFEKLLDNTNAKNKEKAYVKHIAEVSNNYLEIIKSRIDENTLVIKNFNKKLDKSLSKNEESIKDLVSEIDNIVLKELYEKGETLKAKRKEAVARQIAKAILGFLSFFATVASAFIPGAGPAIAAGISAGAKAGAAAIDGTKSEHDTSYRPPDGVQYQIKKFSTNIISTLESEYKSLVIDITNLETKLKRSSSQQDMETLDKLKEIRQKLQESTNKGGKDRLGVIIKLRQNLEQLETQFTRKKREVSTYVLKQTDLRRRTYGRRLLQDDGGDGDDGADEIKAVGEAGKDVIESINSGNDEIAKIDNEIRQNDKDIQTVNKFRTNIQDNILPSVVKFSEAFSLNVGKFIVLSKPLLIEMKFLLQKELNKLRVVMSKISSGFSVFEQIIETAEDLQGILQATLELHDDIDKCEKEMQNVNYIHQMFTPPNIQDITDSDTINMIDILKQNVSQIVLRTNFRKLVYNVKQWSFPFVDFFMSPYMLDNFQYVLQNPILLTDSFKHMQHQFNTYKSDIVKKIDTRLNHANFVPSNSSHPFFTWKYDKYSTEIDSLLTGNTVTLRSSFDDSLDLPYNIVKFNLVKLQFSCEDPGLYQKLLTDLSFFNVDLTHLGQSQYRCNNKVYTIYTQSQTLSYTFENVDGNPIHNNLIYEKMKKGDVLLSPYTFWKIKLGSSKKGDPFELLKPYIGKVSISLEGKGTFVKDEDCTFCTSKLDLFYKPDYLL